MKINVTGLKFGKEDKQLEKELRTKFGKYGKVSTVRIIKTGNVIPVVSAVIIEMPDNTAAEKAINGLDNCSICGSSIKVKKADEDKPKKASGKGKSNKAGSGSFINPYNFMPVKKVNDELKYQYSKKGPHFQDRYRKKTHSGRIVCEITTESEIFIGAGTEEEMNCDANKPAKLKPYTLNGESAIPPTTLKGLLSSIMEAASNSALRVLDSGKYYTRRQDFSELLNKIGMIVVKDGQKYILPLKTGQRRKNPPTQFDFSYSVYLDRYSNGFEAGLLKSRNEEDYSATQKMYYLDKREIKDKIKRGWFIGYELKNSNTNPFFTEDDYNKERDNAVKKNYIKGIFKILGVGPKRKDNIPQNKKHEFFLLYPKQPDENQLFKVCEAETNFNLLSDDRSTHNKDHMKREEKLPYSPKGRERQKEKGEDVLRLKAGDIVYYEDDGRRNATKVSFSACWRDFCGSKKQVGDLKNNAYGYFKLVDEKGFLLPPFMINQGIQSPKDLKLTPVCSMLGFVEEKKDETSAHGLSLAGRLFVSPGILSPDPDNNNVISAGKTLKILDSPKPPCPEFYFTRKNKDKSGNNFISKDCLEPDGNYLPNGRKFYLHHNSDSHIPYANEKSDKSN